MSTFFIVYTVYLLPPSTARAPSFFPLCALRSLRSLWLSFLIFFCPRITGKKINEDYISKKKGGEEKGK